MSSATTIDGSNYGPLSALMGIWKGGEAVDVAAEPCGVKRNPHRDTAHFTASCGNDLNTLRRLS